MALVLTLPWKKELGVPTLVEWDQQMGALILPAKLKLCLSSPLLLFRFSSGRCFSDFSSHVLETVAAGPGEDSAVGFWFRRHFRYAMEPHFAQRHGDDVQRTASKRLMGKVAVITGGARGIGAATARVFAENGASVIIADILDDLGTSLADSIGGRYIHCDVVNEADVESAINLALAWKGKLDIMFNNAGISGTEGSITNLDMEQVKYLLSVNVNGILHGIKHAARVMIKGQEGGCIICMSSSAAIMGGLGSHPYSLSKEAIIGLMRSTACELGVHGIRVNCISPHGVASEMLDMTPEEVSKIVEERGSLLKGRSPRLEDVAQAVMFLASEEAGYITAHNLVIDGGFTSASSNMSFIYQ
ncbi:hypothetical protein NC651_020720 [Populus alba x Populus x berolinensis]|nr:hypothetical protein NC651_020720 [Populus alba x Populus x berolinensis]